MAQVPCSAQSWAHSRAQPRSHHLSGNACRSISAESPYSLLIVTSQSNHWQVTSGDMGTSGVVTKYRRPCSPQAISLKAQICSDMPCHPFGSHRSEFIREVVRYVCMYYSVPSKLQGSHQLSHGLLDSCGYSRLCPIQPFSQQSYR